MPINIWISKYNSFQMNTQRIRMVFWVIKSSIRPSDEDFRALTMIRQMFKTDEDL